MRGSGARTEKRRPHAAGALGGLVLLAAACSAPSSPLPIEAAATSARTLAASAVPRAAGPDARSEGAGVPSAAPPPAEIPFRSDDVFDVAIRGGDVIDGTGGMRRRADVLVTGDRIAHVGVVDASVKAKLVLDATAAVVTPGFVDAHSHGDGGDVNAIAQGVTTVVVGQDGGSPTGAELRSWMRDKAGRLRTNVATLVGHTSVRVKAKAGAIASARDRQVMARLVEEGLDDGAFGLSTGLEYEPGRRADAAELAAVAGPVGRYGGLVMSHLRSEDASDILSSIDELVAQCRVAGARLHVSHIKIVGGHGRDAALAVLAKLDEAARRGTPSTADWYPYTASYTGLEILFPDWARGVGAAPPDRRAGLLRYLHARVMARNGPDATLFGTGTPYPGKTLAEIAKERGIPFENVLADLGPHGGNAAYFVMDEALQDVLFADPRVMVGSDGFGGSRHPRGSGSFARVIETTVEKKHLLTLEEAVRRMTSLPLDTIGAGPDRGKVVRGAIADLAVFDPKEVSERATFAEPTAQARGMRHVLVAGKAVWRAGRLAEGKPGRVLRAPWAKRAAEP